MLRRLLLAVCLRRIGGPSQSHVSRKALRDHMLA
jgi:hypothetical protein